MQILIAIVVIFVVLVKCGSNTSDAPKSDILDSSELKRLAEYNVKARLKDVDSAKFGPMYVFGNITCGTVNAKNSFGGYSSPERFISAGSEATFLESDMKKKDFQYVWDQKCS